MFSWPSAHLQHPAAVRFWLALCAALALVCIHTLIANCSCRPLLCPPLLPPLLLPLLALLLLCAVDVLSPASTLSRSVLKQLLDQDWAAKVFANLVQLLNPEPQAARPAAAAGGVHAVRMALSWPCRWEKGHASSQQRLHRRAVFLVSFLLRQFVRGALDCSFTLPLRCSTLLKHLIHLIQQQAGCMR